MTTTTAPRAEKPSRMDIRLTGPQRSRYEKAAALRGQTLIQWASSHLNRCAERDIAEAAADLLARKPIWV